MLPWLEEWLLRIHTVRGIQMRSLLHEIQLAACFLPSKCFGRRLHPITVYFLWLGHNRDFATKNSKKFFKARFRVFVMFTYLVRSNLDGLSYCSVQLMWLVLRVSPAPR